MTWTGAAVCGGFSIVEPHSGPYVPILCPLTPSWCLFRRVRQTKSNRIRWTGCFNPPGSRRLNPSLRRFWKWYLHNSISSISGRAKWKPLPHRHLKRGPFPQLSLLGSIFWNKVVMSRVGGQLLVFWGLYSINLELKNVQQLKAIEAAPFTPPFQRNQTYHLIEPPLLM